MAIRSAMRSSSVRVVEARAPDLGAHHPMQVISSASHPGSGGARPRPEMPVRHLEPPGVQRDGLDVGKVAFAKPPGSPRRAGSAPLLRGLLQPAQANRSGHPPREDFIPRPALVSRLAGATTPVALIAAPAGYGKTALLAEWDSSDSRPFAWVTLEKGHDDEASVLAAIEDALDDVVPVERHGRGTSTRSRRSSPAVALARIVRSLDSRAAFVLVLDDLQLLCESESWEVVRTLARHVPSGCALALSSRIQPELPVGRLRANRELTEVRSADLKMTTAETAA